MAALEYVEGERARDAAIRAVRKCWLPILERRLAESNDATETWLLGKEVWRLRRCLGLHPQPDQIRAQTRARVAAWRAKRRRQAG